MIRIGIAGYGNLGRGGKVAREQLAQNLAVHRGTDAEMPAHAVRQDVGIFR